MKKKKHNTKYKRKGIVTSDKIVIRKQPLRVIYENDKIYLEDSFGKRIPQTNICLKKGYKGENKERTTLLIPNIPNDALTVDAIATDFDVIYAVDTNSKEFNGKWYSVGVCFRGIPDIHDGMLQGIEFRQFGVAKGVNLEKLEYTEPLVWTTMLNEIKQSQDKDKKILMIVDSFLGDIEAFNNGSKLICGHYKLPDNVTLAYAKADVTDEWPNKIIRHCDRMAGQYLSEEIEQEIKSTQST